MDPLLQFWALIIALISALVVFGGLVLLGLRIIRFLGLAPEGDLSDVEELRFEPRPPPVRHQPDGPAARATAAIQQRRWEACRTAHDVLNEARAIHAKVEDPAGHPRVGDLKPVLAEAEAAATAAEGAMHHDDPEQAVTRVAAELARVRAAAATVDALLKG